MVVISQLLGVLLLLLLLQSSSSYSFLSLFLNLHVSFLRNRQMVVINGYDAIYRRTFVWAAALEPI